MHELCVKQFLASIQGQKLVSVWDSKKCAVACDDVGSIERSFLA